jgi:hypothetical protein
MMLNRIFYSLRERAYIFKDSVPPPTPFNAFDAGKVELKTRDYITLSTIYKNSQPTIPPILSSSYSNHVLDLKIC